MKSSSRRGGVKTWIIVSIGLLVLLVVGAGAVYVVQQRPGPRSDFQAQFRAVEDAVADGAVRDEARFERAEALAMEASRVIDDAAEAFRPPRADERASGGPDIRLAFAEAEDDEVAQTGRAPLVTSYDVEQARAMRAAYAASGVSERLGALLDEGPLLAPHLEAPENGLLFFALLDHLQAMRRLAAAETTVLQGAMLDDDAATAERSFRSVLALARSMYSSPTLISRLVGQAMEALALGTVRESIMAGRVSDRVAEALLEKLRPHAAAGMPSMAHTLDGERVLAKEAVDALYRGEGEELQVDAPLRLLWAGYGTNMDVLDKMFDAGVAMAEASPRDFSVHENELWRLENGLHPVWNAPVAVVVPAMNRSIKTDATMINARRGMILALAIEVYRGRFGDLPDALDDLVARGVLDELPADAFVVEGTWVYQRVEETPGYVLYSKGLDDADDGGAQTEPLWSARAMDMAGQDFVIIGETPE